MKNQIIPVSLNFRLAALLAKRTNEPANQRKNEPANERTKEFLQIFSTVSFS